MWWYKYLICTHPIHILQWRISHIRIQIHLIILSYGISTQESTSIGIIVSGSMVVEVVSSVSERSIVFTSGVESRIGIESGIECFKRKVIYSSCSIDIRIHSTECIIIEHTSHASYAIRNSYYWSEDIGMVVHHSTRISWSWWSLYIIGNESILSDAIDVVFLGC